MVVVGGGELGIFLIKYWSFFLFQINYQFYKNFNSYCAIVAQVQKKVDYRDSATRNERSKRAPTLVIKAKYSTNKGLYVIELLYNLCIVSTKQEETTTNAGNEANQYVIYLM